MYEIDGNSNPHKVVSFYTGYIRGFLSRDDIKDLGLHNGLDPNEFPLEATLEQCIVDEENVTENILDAAFETFFAEDYNQFGHYVALAIEAQDVTLLKCYDIPEIMQFLDLIEDIYLLALGNEPNIDTNELQDVMGDNIYNDAEVVDTLLGAAMNWTTNDCIECSGYFFNTALYLAVKGTN